MAKTLEVEGKEILIKSSKGVMAVIPKDKVSWVKEQIESGKHDVVDKYVGSLKEFKHDNQKAGDGLYANIHAKRARIAAGSGERMRKPGEAGAPTANQFKQAAKTAKAEDGVKIVPPARAMAETSSTQVQMPVKPELNIGGQIVQPQAPLPNLFDLVKKTWNRYSNNGQDRTLLGVASNLIPYYEQFVDVKDVVSGMVSGDKEQMNSGVIGMAAPVAGKLVLSGMDYATEKTLGKKVADAMAIQRNDIVNMSDAERRNLFIKYHNKGGYDKWVKDGRPDLLK